MAANKDTADSRAPARPSPAALGDREFLLTRIFDAPRELVFKTWTDPKHAARWWGPQDFTTVVLEMDVRPGGAWRKCMRSPEGVDYWRWGVYREVVEPERLVFTYLSDDMHSKIGHATLVTVTFADLGSKTKLTLHHTEFESPEARDSHQGGWTSCMERFAEYLETAA